MPDIFIYTTPPDINSGGVTNLFLLLEIFKKKQISAFLCPILKNIQTLQFYSPFNNKTIEEITQQEIDNYFNSTNSIFKESIVNVEALKRRDNIVIYTEDVEGNPAEQKYVVRWLLFFPHPNSAKTYSFETDYICFYSNYIFNLYDNLCENCNMHNYIKPNIDKPNILRVFHFKKDCYKNLDITRDGDCFLVRKGYPPATFIGYSNYHGYSSKIISENTQHGFELVDWGITHDNMISLFNKKKLFLSHDPFTFTNIIASLCGCHSVITKIPNLSKEDWQNSDPFNKYGIAYGIDDVENAMKTCDKVEEHIYNMYLENDANVENFIISINLFFKFKT